MSNGGFIEEGYSDALKTLVESLPYACFNGDMTVIGLVELGALCPVCG